MGSNARNAQSFVRFRSSSFKRYNQYDRLTSVLILAVILKSGAILDNVYLGILA